MADRNKRKRMDNEREHGDQIAGRSPSDHLPLPLVIMDGDTDHLLPISDDERSDTASEGSGMSVDPRCEEFSTHISRH